MGIQKLKKAVASVLCSCVMFVSMITPVQCGVITDTMPAYTDGFAKGYLFEGVHDWNQCEEALQNLTPAVTFFHVTTYYEVDRGIVLTPSETAKIEAEDTAVKTWVAANIHNMVPDGADYNSAVRDIMTWLRKYVKYDHTDMYNNAYQGALTAFSLGKGVCTTYACAFNTLLNYLPFDETGHVNYAAGTQHIPARLVMNEIHAWSMAYVGNQWLYYDPCWYASTGQTIYMNGNTDRTFGGERYHL